MEDNEYNYDNGSEFWQDARFHFGQDEAAIICRDYLAMKIASENPAENRFCQELFAAMFEIVARWTDPGKLVYPYSSDVAAQRMEETSYYDSVKRNNECAQAIDNAIHKSCYEPNYYNLRGAARVAVAEYGFARVNLVLAHTLQTHGWDGRYSPANKEWAEGFELPGGAFGQTILNAHPVLIDNLTKHVRDLYDAVGAKRFALPGHAEHGERVQGYEIIRAIAFDDQRGFAIGYNPSAVTPYVCWQFTSAENGHRDYYWGTYSGSDKYAEDNFRARIIVHMSGEPVREVVPSEKPLSIADRLAHYKNQAAQEQKPTPAHTKGQEVR